MWKQHPMNRTRRANTKERDRRVKQVEDILRASAAHELTTKAASAASGTSGTRDSRGEASASHVPQSSGNDSKER